MDGIRHIITGLLVFSLFVITFISFGVNFAEENNANQTIIDDNSPLKTIYENVDSTLKDYDDQGIQQSANDSFGSFYEEEETSGIIGSITDFFIRSILGVGKTIAGIANTIFEVTLNPLLKTLGIQSEIARVIGIVLSTIMMFTLILLAWKLYRLGY